MEIPTVLSQDDYHPGAGVIIVAAGKSQRMMGEDSKQYDKIFEHILDRPLITHTISAFQKCPDVEEIVLVLGENNLEKGHSLLKQKKWSKLKHVCLGGQRRQDSVKAGLKNLSCFKWVMVHDGARPCVTQETIRLGLEKVKDTGAAIPAVDMNDTIKRIHLPEGIIYETIIREDLRAAQTPQIFRHDILREAYEGNLDGATDDASLVERLGYYVSVFPGSVENIKITNRLDLILAEAILKTRPSN